MQWSWTRVANVLIRLRLIQHWFEVLNDTCVYLVRTDSSGQVYNHQLQIRYRALDLLSEWIDGYYRFDFKTNPSLIKELLAFVKDEVRFHFVLAYFPTGPFSLRQSDLTAHYWHVVPNEILSDLMAGLHARRKREKNCNISPKPDTTWSACMLFTG